MTILRDLKEWLDPVTYHDIVRQIYLNLDLASLKSARQVCREWDRLVMGEVWGSDEGRREVERKLASQWRHGQPVRRETELPELKDGEVRALCCDEKNIAVFLRSYGVWHLSMYNSSDCSLIYQH